MDASAAYFRSSENRPSRHRGALPGRKIAAVVFTVDATGRPASACPASRSRRGRSPRRRPDPVRLRRPDQRRRRRAAGAQPRHEHGVRGFKFHPSLQGFEPNDTAYYPLYETLQELGVPALFHTGQTGIGAGLPGGRGIKLRYSAPMLLDDVAADFPGLTIIMAHPSVPWQDEAISIATHKANVYIDLSGWSPKYFPPQLVRAAGGLLKRKVLFGSDFPLIAPDRWLRDFEALDLKPEVRPLILKDNAARVLGLA